MRKLLHLEPFTASQTLCVLMLDVAEKSLKTHVTVQSKTETALSDMRSTYGHNVESLRVACAKYHQLFDDADIRAFTKDLNDRDGKLYQFLRYGSQETTEGFKTHLGHLLPVIDKIFVQSILLLPEQDRRLIFWTSSLKALLVRSSMDQSLNPDMVISALRASNAQFDGLMTFCKQLELEETTLRERLRDAPPVISQ